MDARLSDWSDTSRITTYRCSGGKDRKMKSYKELFELGDNFHTYVGRGTQQERRAVAKFSAQLEAPDSLPQSTLDRLSEVRISLCW